MRIIIMSNNNKKSSDKIEIFLSDDEKIKSVGELLTNNSSREILQLLFEEELSANEISQKINISLQLAKYHLNKMQEVGMVQISKISKNVKAQDMKYYKATKFAIIILPSKVSERAKESKSLIRSFKTIYKFAGVSAAALAGFLTLSMLQKEQVRIDDNITSKPQNGETISESSPVPSSESSSSGEYMGNVGSGQTGSYTLEEALDLQKRRIESAEANPASGSGTPYLDGGDLMLAFIIIAIVLGGLAAYFFWKAYRHSKSKE